MWLFATFRGMASWHDWRKRFKDYKKDHKITDAFLASEMGIERGTLNSYLNKRDPGLADFMAMCGAAGADPGHILFEMPILREEAAPGTEARKVMVASPSAEPGHQEFVSKLRRFKQKRSRLRRVVVKA